MVFGMLLTSPSSRADSVTVITSASVVAVGFTTAKCKVLVGSLP